MNALNELYEKRIFSRNTPEVSEGYEIVRTDNLSGGDHMYYLMPTRENLLEEIKKIAWAKITYDSNIYESNIHVEAILKSNHTIDDDIKFIETLGRINYDDCSCEQELKGIIMYKDGSWRERMVDEICEWWEHRVMPSEPAWD